MSEQQNNQEWNHGFCNFCSGGAGLCLFSTFCGCIQYGRNVRILGDGDCFGNCCIACCCPPCLGCLFTAPKRKSMRDKYHLKEQCINDNIATCCCPCCSVIQIAAEIETRGVPQQQSMA